MRRLAHLSLALALGLTSATLVACGSRSGLFTAHKATAMQTDLDALSTAVAQQNCTEAATQLGRARDVLQSVQNASPALKARLSAEFDHLGALANVDCQTTTTTTTSSTTPTTSSTTTSTTTTSTTTTMTPTSSTTTTSMTPTTSSSQSSQSTDTGGGSSSPNNGGATSTP